MRYLQTPLVFERKIRWLCGGLNKWLLFVCICWIALFFMRFSVASPLNPGSFVVPQVQFVFGSNAGHQRCSRCPRCQQEFTSTPRCAWLNKASLFAKTYPKKIFDTRLSKYLRAVFREKKIRLKSLRHLHWAITRNLPTSLYDVRGNLRHHTRRINPISLLKLEEILARGSSTPYEVNSMEHKACMNTCKKALAELHPVLRVLYERKMNHSKPGSRNDPYKVGLAIEGGGMRGCVSAGMAIALHYLGLADSFDVIYGSSAGSMIGAYFVSRQIPYEGGSVYCHWIPKAEKRFVDPIRVGRSMGLGPLFDWDLKGFIMDKLGKPVLNLDFLFDEIIKKKQPLDWEAFWRNNSLQPLKVIVSALHSKKSVALDSEHGNFSTLPELLECLRASMLMPGMAGPVVRLSTPGTNLKKFEAPPYVFSRFGDKSLLQNVITGEPLADALLYEPVPYRTAIEEGCTHVLVLRSRPDGVKVRRTGGLSHFIERMISKRFFKCKHGLDEIYEHVSGKKHRLVYMEDMLRLNDATNNATPVNSLGSSCSSYGERSTYLYALALAEGAAELKKTDSSLSSVLKGLKNGFARAFDLLVEDPSLTSMGSEEVEQVFPFEVWDDAAESNRLSCPPIYNQNIRDENLFYNAKSSSSYDKNSLSATGNSGVTSGSDLDDFLSNMGVTLEQKVIRSQ